MRWSNRIFAFLCGWLGATAVQAQVAVPGGGIPSLPPWPQVTGSTLGDTAGAALGDVRALSSVRNLQVEALLRDHRREVDRDAQGAPVVRDEIVAIDPAPVALQALQRAGFTVGGDTVLDPLPLHVVSLRAPPGAGTRAALALARRLDPDGSYDFDHLLWRSGVRTGVATATVATTVATAAVMPAHRFSVGLIDSGIDAAHAALAGTTIRRWGCGGQSIPDAHGTEVASLLAGRAVTGASTGAALYAADVYCGQPTGGSAVAVTQALAWMARERVGVINISLVGPPDALLAKAIAAAQARGHVIVAAVGNDGPTAPPLYPASYPGVVGVSAVNARERVLPEAGRGPQVDFVAPGADMVAAAPNGRWAQVRGTSFAAPLVARLAATLLSQPDPQAAAAAVARLTQQAVLPAGARADAYGHGLVGATLPMQHAPATN